MGVGLGGGASLTLLPSGTTAGLTYDFVNISKKGFLCCRRDDI